MTTSHAVLGAGPLGLATAKALGQRGVTSHLVSRSEPSDLAPLASSTRHHALDLHDTAALVQLLRSCSVAYFCAQPAYHRWPQEFATMQAAVLMACEQAGCSLVLADNLYGYGLPAVGTPLSEDSPVQPNTRKGQVRAAMTRDALQASARGQVRLAIVRASDFFGPGVRHSALGERVWTRLLAGQKVPFSGDPDQLHSYAYVEDFAAAMVHLATQGSGWGRVWHAPHQPAMSTRQLLQQACDQADLPAPQFRIEGRVALVIAGMFIPAAREVIEMLPNFECRYVVDDKRWQREQSLAATPLPQALDATVRWIRSASARQTITA